MTAGDVPILTPDQEPTPERGATCCERIVDAYQSGWCILPIGHLPPCVGTPARFGCDAPPVDRKIKSAFNHDIAMKWHHSKAMRDQWLTKWKLPVDS